MYNSYLVRVLMAMKWKASSKRMTKGEMEGREMKDRRRRKLFEVRVFVRPVVKIRIH